MFPGFRNMDPYSQHLPHPREHSPSSYHYYPTWEPRPPHMKADSFKHPSSFEPWPYSGTAEQGSCCNHSYPPGYYSTRPPYFHYHPPPQMYYPSPYPPYPDSYPPYFIPPYYAADHARFDYDKERYHCCGCPNHFCRKQEGLRIEEENATPKKLGEKSTVKIVEEPEIGAKDSHNSLIRFPGSHYPGWLPYNRHTREGKTENNSQSLPVLGFNDLKGLQQGVGNNNPQGDGKFSQMPYPIYWFPGSDKPEELVTDKKETDAAPISVEDWPSRLRRSPLKLLDNANSDEKTKAVDTEPKIEHSMDRVVEKEKKVRTIPVVYHDSSNEKLSMPVKSDEQDRLKKSVAPGKDSSKKKPSSTKTSKLPPVCLRVDPLPKKNGSNVKAQFVNPPGSEEKREDSKDSNDQVANMNVANPLPRRIDVIDDNCKLSTGVGNDSEKVDSSQNRIENKEVKTNLSPEEAALLIQSAYRGFSVRRWQPLEKLRKIELIRRKVAAVKNQVQNCESSSELDVKQKVVISETIMDLLLQLDAIQGLLPSLREVRKSVARELVFLQDKLDQLYNQAMHEHEERTAEKDEKFNTGPETISPASESHMNENKLIEQPSLPSNEENVHVQEIGASSVASDSKPAIFNNIACAMEQDEKEELVDVVPPGTKYDQGMQDKCKNDRQEDNLSSLAGNISMVENVASDDHDGEVANSVLLQQSDGDQDYGCKHFLTGAEYNKAPEDEDEDGRQVDLLSIAGEVSMVNDKSISDDVVLRPHEGDVANAVLEQRRVEGEDSNCSTEFLINEVKFDLKPEAEEVLAEKCEEENRQSLFEEEYLKGSEDRSNMEEDPTIKSEVVIGERNGEGNMEISDKGLMSVEVKTTAALSDEVGRSENCQHEQGLSNATNPNQADVHEATETQIFSLVKDHGEVNQSTEGGLCAESAATNVDGGDSQIKSRLTSVIPVTETSSVEGHDDADSLETPRTGVQSEFSDTIECGSRAEQDMSPATISTDEMGRVEASTLESSARTVHGKSTSRGACDYELSIMENKIMDENAELRQMLKRLLNAGQEQMGVISKLNDRVKNLERRLSRKKKAKANHHHKPCKPPSSLPREQPGEEVFSSTT